MKNKIVVSLLFCTILIFVLTGCGSKTKNVDNRTQKPYVLQNETAVYNYLEEKYPEEDFEIINWEYQEQYTNARNWNVKSLSTNIEFKVYDDTECRPADIFECEELYYIVVDTYKYAKLN